MKNYKNNENNIEKIKTELAKLEYKWQPILLKVDTKGTLVID